MDSAQSRDQIAHLFLVAAIAARSANRKVQGAREELLIILPKKSGRIAAHFAPESSSASYTSLKTAMQFTFRT